MVFRIVGETGPVEVNFVHEPAIDLSQPKMLEIARVELELDIHELDRD